MKIGEFFVELGLTGGAKSATTVGGLIEKFKDMHAATVAGAASLTELIHQFQDIADASFKAAIGLKQFEMQTGLSAQELQMWQHVGEQAGITADTMAQGVMSLQRNLAALKMGQGNAAPFQLLGVSPYQSAFNVIMQTRKRIKELGLDRSTATNLIAQMGLSPEMMILMEKSDAELKSMVGTAGVMSEQQQKAFVEGEHALVRFHQSLQQTKYTLVQVFAPVYIGALKLMATLLSTAAGQATALAAAVGLLIISLIPLGAAIWAAFLPFLPVAGLIAGIVAGIALLILVLEDLYVYSKGGKSVFGELMEGFDALEKKLANTKVGKLLDLMGGLSGFGAAMIGNPAGVAGGVASNFTQYLTQHINGVGSPGEVAKQSATENAKAVREAVMQTNQQGY